MEKTTTFNGTGNYLLIRYNKTTRKTNVDIYIDYEEVLSDFNNHKEGLTLILNLRNGDTIKIKGVTQTC